jgi:hypothetical protein
MALQRAFSWTPSRVPAPDLFAYLLLRRAHALEALSALGEPNSAEAAFLAGRALEHLGEATASAAMYERAAGPAAPGDAAWLFSPILGTQEAARLSWARRGELLGASSQKGEREALWGRALTEEGGGSLLATAAVAAAQARQGAEKPFANPAAAAEEALVAAAGLAAQLPTGERDNLLSALYPARVAAVAQSAAAIHLMAGRPRRALDLLEQAHRKAAGYRPDFVNRPAFIVDLARAYAAAGEYAPAVAALFEMSRRYPESRLAYESLKRLYAARAGGGSQPRY